MAIVDFPRTRNVTADIFTKDGRKFLKCDVLPGSLGVVDGVVKFWFNGAVRMVPLEDVLHVDTRAEQGD